MANQADVIVKNGFVDQAIRVRRTLPDGSWSDTIYKWGSVSGSVLA